MAKSIQYYLKNISWLNSLFLFLTPPTAIILTIAWLYVDGFSWEILALGILFYCLTGLSITAGYHRLFSHKAYDAHPIVKIFFLSFGAAAFQNSVLKWASDHRIHHREVDTDHDPYNINEGFFYAHMGWILVKGNEYDPRYVQDLAADKWIRLQHKYYFPIAGFFGIILPAIMGWLFFNSLLGGIAIGALMKVVLLHHSTFFINSLCHYIGSTPYTDSNTAKDSWIMALLTFGEGYHNFHHYFQADYRNGIRWFQFDPTKWIIKILEKLKLAYKLRTTPEFRIQAAKLQMKLIELKKKVTIDEHKFVELETLKSKAIDSLKHFEELTQKYKEAKEKLPTVSLAELKEKAELAKIEFEYNIQKFNLMVKQFQMTNAY